MVVAFVAIVAIIVIGFIVWRLTRKDDEPETPAEEYVEPLPPGYGVAFATDDETSNPDMRWDAWLVYEGEPVENSAMWGPTAGEAAKRVVKEFHSLNNFRDEGDIAHERIKAMYTTPDDIQERLNKD